jgi:hypothetical protein
MSIVARRQFMPSRYHNYVIAGNVCNAFALGEVGSSADFFLVGVEPGEESPYPLLTGNILDAEGNLLCCLVRNIVVVNPGKCSRICGNYLGYDIHDRNNQVIFRVRTVFERLPGLAEETFVTTITANVYDREGRFAFQATAGEEDEYIGAQVKCAFGFSGAIDFVHGMHEQELQVLRAVFQSRGAVHELVTGALEGQEIMLDGKALINAHITNCVVHVKTGEFATLGNVNFDNCRILFHDTADNIRTLVLALQEQSSGEPRSQNGLNLE